MIMMHAETRAQKMQIEVKDDFFPREVFDNLQNLILSQDIPWYWQGSSVHDDDGCPQYCHMAYCDFVPQSFVWDYTRDVIRFLNPVGIFRVKYNSTSRTSEVIEKPLHYDLTRQDNTQPDFKICILYLNDNDGYTHFETGQKVYSKSNRAVIFPSNIKHGGSSCTNADRRVVLNVDFA
jgi:hypothetical protein